MLGGYAGKMLFVDLTSGKMEEKELTDYLARNFIGGYGIGAKILYEMMPPGTDPLGPQSILGFITGPTNGAKAFYGGRYTMVHKSPVTGGWNDANSGGYFGPELKQAGYDAVFFTGISNKPVYLWIKDGKAELRDAAHLWGADAKETWELLKKETGDDKTRVVTIGPSGEKLALMSCPINDGHRAPGRGGGGAVMGSKKLKAIAVRGTGKVSVANPQKVVEVNKKVTDSMEKNNAAGEWKEWGTGGTTTPTTLMGDAPVKNWEGISSVDFGEEKVVKTASPVLDKYKTKKYFCHTCPLGCGAEYKVDTGRWPVGDTERPEYETMAAFCSNLLCDEDDMLIKCNELCNRAGLDTISAGMTISWAMECYNKGILTKKELDGIDLTWGNGQAIVAVMEKTAAGEGCGAVLMHGSAYAAKHWGKGEECLVTASGIELPMHDPRCLPGLARTYQYDPTPGRHVKGSLAFNGGQGGMPPEKKYNFENTGKEDARVTSEKEMINCAGLCMFGSNWWQVGIENEFIEAILGIPFTKEDGYKTGLRILALRQAFNVREGIKPSDMTMSERALGKPPLKSGPTGGITIDGEKLAKNFYDAVGWDMKTGKPSLETLRSLGELDFVIKDLYGA